MSDTITDHMQDCKTVSDVVDNANALLTKAKFELQTAREVLETIKPYLHPLHKITNHSTKRLTGIETATPAQFAEEEIARINKLLGDRA